MMKNINEDTAEEPSKSEFNTKTNMWLFWKQRRYVLTFMLMLGQAIMFSLRMNISVAIIPMTTDVTNEDGSVSQKADFNWNSKEQGIILSAFFYGSMVTQLPGGILAKRFNGAKLFGAAIGIASFLAVITPFVAQNLYLMVGIRTLQGLFLGITFPTQMSLIAQWAPLNERARMTMFTNSGLYFGTVIALQFSGIISDYLGWRSVFYIFGILGLVWYIVWINVAKETPEKDKRITEEEKRLIIDSNGTQGNRHIQIPWWSILTSIPVWALIAAHFTHCWLAYTLMTHMPKFFSQIVNVQMSKTGFLSCLPYLINGCVSSFSGLLADTLLSKGILSVIQTRKLFTCTAFLLQSIFLLVLTLFMTPIASIVLLTITVSFSSFAMTGFWINFIDIAPQFTGILFALSNTIATLSGVIAPTLTGFIVQNESIAEWKLVFYISAATCMTGSLIYGLTADGTVQPWAKIQTNKENVYIELDQNPQTPSKNNCIK